MVELDGGQHYGDDRSYDEKRTAYLERVGILVLRFSNADIWNNFRGVCLQIDNAVKRLKQI